MPQPRLAILGSAPRFAPELHVGRPNIGDRGALHARLDAILDSRFLSNGGPMVEELEARLVELTGARHAIAMVNATLGLEIAARAAGLSGEVIIPSFTFIATAHALRWAGLEPVFADIDAETLTIDPAHVERLITPRTSGIVGVHLWGRTCDVEQLDAIADRHGLTVLYDAAHALACSRGGRMVGTFGRAEVFSFHATKFVNAFEGGAITTDDDALAERCRLMRNFGIVDWDETAMLGTNAKLHEMSAAMGITSLEAMPAIIARNLANLDAYDRDLSGLPGIRMLMDRSDERRNGQHAVARVDPDRASLTRDELHTVLVAEGILARRYFFPGCHRLEPYASAPGGIPSLPETERASEACLSLPTGTAVGPDEIAVVCAVIRLALDHAPAIRRRLLELAEGVSAAP
jgi:dTDP-4-amino-4,6-dideoxygalactose transaminase